MVVGEVDLVGNQEVGVPEAEIRVVVRIVLGEGRAAAEETMVPAVENPVVGIVLLIRCCQRGI